MARILVFLLALTHVVGLADLVIADACGDACSDDGCGTDDCMPGAACRCHCPSTTPLLSGSATAPAAARDQIAIAAVGFTAERAHASPDPREILHVPRRAV